MTSAVIAVLVFHLSLGPVLAARASNGPARDAPVQAPQFGPSVPPEIVAEAASAEAVRAFFAARRSGLSPSEIDALSFVVAREARLADLPLRLVLALIHVESSGRVAVRSHAGAIGLMQLLPPTARAVARTHGLEWTGAATLENPQANVRLGVRYLAQLAERFGDLQVALTAYNWGPTRVSSMLRRGQKLPSGYAQSVLAAAEDPRLGA